MRPIIIGRDFIYQNEIKISYYQSGHTRLELQDEELIAEVEVAGCPQLSLQGPTVIPSKIIGSGQCLEWHH